MQIRTCDHVCDQMTIATVFPLCRSLQGGDNAVSKVSEDVRIATVMAISGIASSVLPKTRLSVVIIIS